MGVSFRFGDPVRLGAGMQREWPDIGNRAGTAERVDEGKRMVEVHWAILGARMYLPFDEVEHVK